MATLKDRVRSLASADKTIKTLAEEVYGIVIDKVSSRWWQYERVRVVVRQEGLPHLDKSRLCGAENPSYRGNFVDELGYVWVGAPLGHPYACGLDENHKSGKITLHRLVMEQSLGRYLLPHEVVDHINGCTVDNRLENLRLFASNGEHLKQTLAGKTPQWSTEGRDKVMNPLNSTAQRINTHWKRRRSGEIRVQQILRGRELLGKEHPLLFGMERYLDSNDN